MNLYSSRLVLSRPISLLLLVMIVCHCARSQQYVRRESSVTIPGPKHDILLAPDQGYTVITYPFKDDKDPITITRFDHNLAQVYTTSLKDLSLQHYHKGCYVNDHLYLYCDDNQGAVSRFEVDDKTGQLIGSPLSLFPLGGKETDPKYYIGNSENKQYYYLAVSNHEGPFKNDDGKTIQGLIMDNSMKIISRFSYSTPELLKDFQDMDLLLSDKGTLHFVYGVAAKPKHDDYIPYKYNFVTVDGKGKTTAFPLDLPEGDLRNISWMIKNDRVQFAGFLAQKKKGFTTVLTGDLDPLQKKVDNIRQTAVSALLPADISDYFKKLGEKGLSEDASLATTAYLGDGSRELVLEINGDHIYQSYFANSTRPSYSAAHFTRENMYVLKLDAGNTPKWLNVISKNQEESDVPIRIGIACSIDNAASLHIFFMDLEKNTEPNYRLQTSLISLQWKDKMIADVTISLDGKMKKQFIYRGSDFETAMMPESYTAGRNNEVSFMSFAPRSKITFSVEKLLNNGIFHFCILRLGSQAGNTVSR